MADHPFTCADSAGEPHRYTCNPHLGEHGLPITLKLSAMFIEPLMSAAGPVVAEAVMTGGITSLKTALRNEDVIEMLDWDRLGQTVNGLLAGLPIPLVYNILRFTSRDGKELINAETIKPTLAFNEAYSRNYLEIGKALWQVCKFNRFFPGLGSLASDGEKAIAAAQEAPKSTD